MIAWDVEMMKNKPPFCLNDIIIIVSGVFELFLIITTLTIIDILLYYFNTNKLPYYDRKLWPTRCPSQFVTEIVIDYFQLWRTKICTENELQLCQNIWKLWPDQSSKVSMIVTGGSQFVTNYRSLWRLVTDPPQSSQHIFFSGFYWDTARIKCARWLQFNTSSWLHPQLFAMNSTHPTPTPPQLHPPTCEQVCNELWRRVSGGGWSRLLGVGDCNNSGERL